MKIMKQQNMLVERIMSRAKNNPIVACLILLGTAVIALEAATGAVKNLYNSIGDILDVAVAGTWTTQVLTNPFDKTDTFRLSFDLQSKGDVVLGSIRMTSTTGRYDIAQGLLDGKTKGNTISFHTLERSREAGDPQRETIYKDFYIGTVSKNAIAFTLHSDRPWGFPPQTFQARRE